METIDVLQGIERGFPDDVLKTKLGEEKTRICKKCGEIVDA